MRFAYISHWRVVQNQTFSLSSVIVSGPDTIAAFCPGDQEEKDHWENVIEGWRQARDSRKPIAFLKQLARTGNGITEEFDSVRYIDAVSLEEAQEKAYERVKRRRGSSINLFGPQFNWAVPATVRSLLTKQLPDSLLWDNEEFLKHEQIDVGASKSSANAINLETSALTPLTNLPASASSFVGREIGIETIQELLSDTAVLSLHGAGGCGKTRLALEFGHQLLPDYAAGVWLIDLATVVSDDFIPEAIAAIIGLSEDSSTPALSILINFFADRRALLILDNCDDTAEAIERLLADLRPYCPALKVLTTSRQPLILSGGIEWRVPSLSLPQRIPLNVRSAVKFGAIQLFADRAGLSLSRVGFRSENLRRVVNICQIVDGIPLAIELVAARARVLSVDSVVTLIHNHFGDDLPQNRARTVQALVDWSSDLLTVAARQLLCRLSVFAGQWTAETAHEVCAVAGIQGSDIDSLLNELQRFSLINIGPDEESVSYYMLDVICDFALERLKRGEGGLNSMTMCIRHCEYFLSLAERMQPMLYGPDQATGIILMESEHGNFRAALQYCDSIPSGAAIALRLTAALRRFWEIRGHLAEGRAHLHSALKRDAAQVATLERARALNAAGMLALTQGEGTASKDYHLESLEISKSLGDKTGVALASNGLGAASAALGNKHTALYYNRKALEIFQELGDKRGIASTLNNLGLVAKDLGDQQQALLNLKESLELRQEMGNARGTASSLNSLGRLAQDRSDYEGARAFYEESLTIQQKIGNKRGIAIVLNNLGEVDAALCNFTAARTYYEKSLEISRQLGERQALARLYLNIGHLERWHQEYQRAEGLYRESLSLARELNIRSLVGFALRDLGVVLLHQGDIDQGFECLKRSLDIRLETEDEHGIVRCLEGFALVAFARGDIGRTTKLLGAAEALRAVINFPLPPVDRIDYQVVLEAQFKLGAEDFASHWHDGQSLSRDQALKLATAETDKD